MYTVYTQDAFHSRQWKIMENHTFVEDGTCFCMEFFYKNRQVRFNLVVWWNLRSPIFGPNMVPHGAPLGRGPSPQACQNSSAAWQIWTFRVFGKGVEWNSPRLSLQMPPDASRCLQMPPVLKYVKSPFCNGYVNIGQIYKWWISKNIGFSRSMGTDPLEVQEHLLRSGIMYYLFLCKKIEALKI